MKHKEFSADSIINTKVKAAITGLKQKCIRDLFLEFPTDRDKELVADFIIACDRQENIAISTKRAYLVELARLSKSKSKSVKKPLESMVAKDLTEYLNSIQPEDKSADPDESWINTQKAYCMPLLKFFKWLAYPDSTPQERKHMSRDKLPSLVYLLLFSNYHA